MTIEELLILNEGLQLKPYLDSVGKLTIGVGRNLTDKGISKDEAIFLLQNDIQQAERDVRKVFINFSDYNENVKLVLIDMMFNLGLPKFLTFKKFIKAIKENNFKRAAEEMMNSKWAKQVKERAKRDAAILLGIYT